MWVFRGISKDRQLLGTGRKNPEMINLVYICPERRWDKEPMMNVRNKGVKMCL